jgi:hypothetical protein
VNLLDPPVRGGAVVVLVALFIRNLNRGGDGDAAG